MLSCSPGPMRRFGHAARLPERLGQGTGDRTGVDGTLVAAEPPQRRADRTRFQRDRGDAYPTAGRMTARPDERQVSVLVPGGRQGCRPPFRDQSERLVVVHLERRDRANEFVRLTLRDGDEPHRPVVARGCSLPVQDDETEQTGGDVRVRGGDGIWIVRIWIVRIWVDRIWVVTIWVVDIIVVR